QDRMPGPELLFGQQVKTVEVDPPDARYHRKARGSGEHPLSGPADVGQSDGQAADGLSQYDDREQSHTFDQVFGMHRDGAEPPRQDEDERHRSNTIPRWNTQYRCGAGNRIEARLTVAPTGVTQPSSASK